MQPN